MADEADQLLSAQEWSIVFFRRAGTAVNRDGDDHFRGLLDALPAAIYTTDADGRITYYNDAAATLWGHRPEVGKAEWCGSWKLFQVDGTPLPHGDCPMALALKNSRPVRGIEAIAERPDGSRVRFLPFPTPLYDPSGTLVGAINMLVDVSDRERAELYARQLASIVESSNDAIISKDLDGIISSWNRGAERLFGYKAEEVIGRSITILIPWDRLDEEVGILERIRRGERIHTYETVRQRKDGSPVEISLTVSPVKDADGRISGASKIARDITERKRAEEQQRLLVGEMRHRIKNSLATVQAIASQTLHSASAEERRAFIARLHALSSAHDLLKIERWDSAALREVIDMALQAFQETHRERFKVDGPQDVRVDANKAMLLVMALHELATNAVKYGALSNRSGLVTVTWELLQDGRPKPRLKLCWRERGGPPVKPPGRKGFGSQLLERAFEGNDASKRVEFDPQGFVCELELSL